MRFKLAQFSSYISAPSFHQNMVDSDSNKQQFPSQWVTSWWLHTGFDPTSSFYHTDVRSVFSPNIWKNKSLEKVSLWRFAIKALLLYMFNYNHNNEFNLRKSQTALFFSSVKWQTLWHTMHTLKGQFSVGVFLKHNKLSLSLFQTEAVSLFTGCEMLKLLCLSTGSFSISALKMDLDPVLPFLWTTSLSAWTASWHVSVFKKHYSFFFL